MGIKFGANNSEGSNRGSRMSLDEYMKEINSMKEKDKNKKSSSSNNDEEYGARERSRRSFWER